VVEFAASLWLLLLPLPVAIWWFGRRRSSRRDRDGALLHPMAALIGRLQAPRRPGTPIPWLWLFGCGLLVVALARPQWIDPDPPDGEPGHNMVFAIDVSGSMRILDYRVDGRPASRLDMLKSSLIRFLEHAPRMRAGVVVFADDVMTFVPLTTDLALAAEMVGEIDNSLAGERTALGDAIALSLRRMQAVTEADASRVLVLMTDGVPTAGTIDPEAAAGLARAAGIRIYTVGIGGGTPAPFPLSPTGEQTIADIPLDEPFLQALAATTDGAYFRIVEDGDLLQALDHIDRLERSLIPAGAVVREAYWLPALAGLALLVLADRRRRLAYPATVS
jgi:Ca-activated chloride channel homolog